MSKLSERQRLILTIAVTVLLTGGLLALIFKDRSEIDRVNDEISGLDARIRAADHEIRKTKDREDQVLVFRAVEDRELAVLPTAQEIAGFHRNISTFLSSAGLSFQELPESTPVESGLAKGIFVTRTVLSGTGDAASILKFVNMIENDQRLIAVKGLKVKAGMKDRERPGGTVMHDVDVHLETYFYNPQPKATNRNKIQGEEARLQDEDIKQAIASFEPERPDTYVLRPSVSRRDPLVDPRRRRPSIDPSELEEAYVAQETIVLELEGRIDDIDEKMEQEKAFVQEGRLFRRDRLAREIEGNLNEILVHLSQIDQMKKVVIPDLVVRVEEVRGRLDALRGRRTPVSLVVTRHIAEGHLDEVVKAMEAGDYTEVANLTSLWVVYLEGKNVDPSARPVVEKIAELRLRAKNLSDFQAYPRRVTGTIVHPGDPGRSVALVNGKPLHVGDALDTGGEVILKTIERAAVEFLYRGETIRVERGSGNGKDNVDVAAAHGIKASLR